MAPRKLTVAEHYRNYELLTDSFGLQKQNGLPEFDYVTRDILKKVLFAAGSFDETFDRDINLIFINFLTYGHQIFDLHERNPRSKYTQNVQKVLAKYNTTRYIADQHRPRIYRATTIEQLMMCLPHLTAKVYICDLDIEPAMSVATLQQNCLQKISPACAVISSFALLPKYRVDADDEFFNIIKTMLLFQYEELEVLEQYNDRYIRQSPARKMNRLISIAKVIYESYHMCADMRWFCYRTFFIKEFTTLTPFVYSEAAAIFDQRFGLQSNEVTEAFELRMGSKRTLNLSQKQIDHLMRKKELLDDQDIIEIND